MRDHVSMLMTAKLSRVRIYNEGLPSIKSKGPLIY